MTTLADIPLSMLDLVPVRTGGSVAEALHNSLDLARHVERLGFNRFWLAEHHNMDGIASSATALLIGHIAGGTSRIRVGSGGVMLPNHAPLVVAENFGTLETLYPGRIDLGLGRAPAPTRRPCAPCVATAWATATTSRAGRRAGNAARPAPFPAEPAGGAGRGYPGADLATPVRACSALTWRRRKACPMPSLPHFAPRYLHEALRIYRSNFQPSAVLDKPYAMIGVPLIAAPTDEEAEFLATTAFQRVLALIRGESLKQKPPVESMAPLWLPHEQDAVGSFFGLAVIGGPEKVRARLEILLEQTGADELIFTSDFYEHAHRLRSCEIVAELKGA